MKKLISLIAFMVLFSGITTLTTHAQTPSWEWAIGGGSALNDESNKIATLPDGSLVIGGSYGGNTFTLDSLTLTHPNANSWADSRWFLARMDENGNVIWLIQNQGIYATITDIHTDNNGFIYVIGNYEGQMTIGSTIVQGSAVLSTFFAKFDSNGNLLWVSKGYNSGLGTGNVAGQNVTVDFQGNMYFQGTFHCLQMSFSNINPVLTNSGINQHFVVKFDSAGNYQWASQSDAFCIIWVEDISVDTLGNVFISGSSFNSDMVFPPITIPNNGGIDCYIFKLNTNGVPMWGKSIGSGGDEGGSNIAADKSGNLYASGGFNSNSITLGTYTLQNSGLSDVFLCKYDSWGNVLWANKIYGSEGESIGDMTVTENNDHFLITGSYSSPTLNLGINSINNAGSSSNAFVAEYDTAGINIWATGTANVSGNISPLGITFSNASEIYITGHMFNAPNFNIGPYLLGSYGASEIFAAKLSIASTSIIEEMDLEFPFVNVYPVPAHESFTVSFEVKTASNVSLSLSDITGKIVTHLIDKKQMSAGIYSHTYAGHSRGVYYLTYTVNDHSTKRLVIIQ